MVWVLMPVLVLSSQGKRAALRSATIMLRQPLQRLYSMQASDIDIYRKVTREKTHTMVREEQAQAGVAAGAVTDDALTGWCSM
jgi:ATP-dependent protease ClpP protease subunit